MNRFLRMIRPAVGDLVNDSLVLSGAGMVVWGIWQIYQPAAWIVGGAVLLWYGLARASGE